MRSGRGCATLTVAVSDAGPAVVVRHRHRHLERAVVAVDVVDSRRELRRGRRRIGGAVVPVDRRRVCVERPGSVNVALTVAVPPSSIVSPTAVTVGSTLMTVTVAVSVSVSAVAAVTSPPMSLTVRSIVVDSVVDRRCTSGVAIVGSSRFVAGDQE